ncbi:MAG: TadE family protein [Pseudomonadota bacterium]
MNLENQKGAAVVEFALIGSLLFWLLFGIIEFSICLYDKQMLTNATREGARAGIVAGTPRLTDTEIKNIVLGYAEQYLVTFGGDSLQADDISIVPAGNRDALTFGTNLTVSATYQYNFLVLPRFVDGILGNISSSSTMKLD